MAAQTIRRLTETEGREFALMLLAGAPVADIVPYFWTTPPAPETQRLQDTRKLLVARQDAINPHLRRTQQLFPRSRAVNNHRLLLAVWRRPEIRLFFFLFHIPILLFPDAVCQAFAPLCTRTLFPVQSTCTY